MKQLLKYSSILAMVVVALLVSTGIVGAADILPLFGIGGATGITIGAGIAGAATIENYYNTEVLDNEYEKAMTIIKPDEYPLEHLMRNIRKAYTWNGMEVTYPSVEVRPIQDTVNGAVSAVADAASAGTASVAVDNGSQWLVDDIIRFNGINGGNSKPFTAQVVAKSGSTLTIMALNGLSTYTNGIPAIADESSISRVGNAKDEIAAENQVYNAIPPTVKNYMQIHMGQIEESLLYKKYAKNIKYDKTLQRMLAMYNFRFEAEATYLFGAKALKTDTESGKLKYTTGGAEFFIENEFNYGSSSAKTTFTEDNWTSITKNVFSDNAGSSRRIMFVGSTLLERISNISGISKQLNATDSVEVLWGIRFRKVMTEFGELLLKHHKMFNYYGYSDKGMILDLDNIDKYVFEPFQKTSMDYDKTGSKRVDSERFHEISCLAFKYPDTHAIITPTP